MNQSHPPAETVLEATQSENEFGSGGAAATFSRNAAISVGRLFVTTAVALILPAYLTHKLPVKTYSAWVLILQMSAYVSYLDFGIQTGIAKFVSEYEARKDYPGASMRASTGLALMLAMSALGIILTVVLAARVHHLFHDLPPALYRDVKLALLFVGISLSFTLLSAAFAAIFIGLQRYSVPVVITIANRLLYTSVVLIAVSRNESLAVMGAAVAVVNILTALAQIVAWRKLAGRIRLSLRGLDPVVLRRMLGYCSSLAIWSAGMLCVSGLDVTIVGRYDFTQTAYYSIAVLPTTFMVAMMGAALAPLLPTASALAVHRSPAEMGVLLSRSTRYSSLLLLLCGIPMLVLGYPILKLWVGPAYAAHTFGYLRILILANVLRNLCLPYSSMLVATESQKVAIFGATAEAVVNVVASVLLVRHIGALGVAYGTLIGSFVSVAMHFFFSMQFTQTRFAISRFRLLLAGMLRPAIITLPSLLLVQFWWTAANPSLSFLVWIAWVSATLLLAWFAALDPSERKRLQTRLRHYRQVLTRYNGASPTRT